MGVFVENFLLAYLLCVVDSYLLREQIVVLKRYWQRPVPIHAHTQSRKKDPSDEEKGKYPPPKKIVLAATDLGSRQLQSGQPELVARCGGGKKVKSWAAGTEDRWSLLAVGKHRWVGHAS